MNDNRSGLPEPTWTGRDGAYGLGPSAPVPPPYWYTPASATWAPLPPETRRRSVGWKIAAGAAVVAAAAGGFAVGVWRAPTRTVRVAASAPSARRPGGSSTTNPFGGSSSAGNPFGSMQNPTFGLGNGSGSGSAGSSRASGTHAASARQSSGIVDIDTQLGFQGEEGAGTGMVLSSDGYVLTNNHVVDGATSIDATVVSGGRTYTATVVGTDPTKDVAVIKLSGAGGLTTANLGSATSVGAAVTGVGNAGGTGGTPSAAAGKVVALNQKLTASDDGSNPEKLTGMIETDADIIPGDSGGPLYDSSDRIIGMDTAASSAGRSTRGYAIPIETARSIASKIESGVRTSAIHLGYPGFLGIEVGTAAGSGAPIAGVVQGGPAQQAGLVAGDDITAVDGSTVNGPTALHDLVGGLRPGQQVSVRYTTPRGMSRTTTVDLGTGPAD